MKQIIEKLRELAKKLALKFGVAVGVAAAALALSTATPAIAQTGRSVHILADTIANITVSNGIPYYNLKSAGGNGTNLVGLGFTTASGSNIVVSATNNTTTVLTRSVDLWSYPTYVVPPANANISCTYSAGAGNTTTNLLIFVPVPDGTNEDTAAGDAFVWPLTANGTNILTVCTNNPLKNWQGSLKFRLKAAYAGTNAAAGQFNILDLRFNSFPP